MRSAFFTLIAVLALGGCVKTGVSDDEVRAQQQEFSQENYEKAMIEAGRQDELEAEKAKWAEHGHNPDDQQGGSGNPAGPREDGR